jgi:hypothetical protein
VRIGQIINVRADMVAVTTQLGDPASLFLVTPRLKADFTPQGAGVRYMPVKVASDATCAIGILTIPEDANGSAGLMNVSYSADPAQTFPGNAAVNTVDINTSFIWVHGA